MAMSPTIDAFAIARNAMLGLLASRAVDATVCPSEVARALAAAASDQSADLEWRTMMPAVHAVVDRLVDLGEVQLSWKGQTLLSRSGPYRIGRRASE